MELIPVGNLWALVDDDDYEYVSRFNWKPLKTSNTTIYARRNPNTKNRKNLSKYPQSPYMYMHRMIMRAHGIVDHINGNTLDNRKKNLRIVSPQQSSCNTRGKNVGKKYKGVYWDKDRQLWRAAISLNRRTIFLGRFETIEDAKIAYDKAVIKYHGEFGKTNDQIAEEKFLCQTM